MLDRNVLLRQKRHEVPEATLSCPDRNQAVFHHYRHYEGLRLLPSVCDSKLIQQTLFNKLETRVNLNRIKVVLVEQGKSGKWLAEQLNKSTCTVSKWCTNTAQPDLQTLDQIAKILKVDIKTLLYDTKFNENI